MDLATSAVALIILFDLATGQGPPGLNSYLGPPPPREYQLPPPPQIIQYMPRGEYDANKRLDKPINDPKEEYNDNDKEDKYMAKSYEKEDKDFDKKYKSSTPAPGVFASFSNSMTDAWKSLTTLGRQTRSIPQTRTAQLNADTKFIRNY